MGIAGLEDLILRYMRQTGLNLTGPLAEAENAVQKHCRSLPYKWTYHALYLTFEFVVVRPPLYAALPPTDSGRCCNQGK